MVGILRVATWNLGYGSPKQYDLEKLPKSLQYLKEHNVDIVLAQEIPDAESFRHIYPNHFYSYIPIYNPEGTGIWGNFNFSEDTRNNNHRPKWGTAVLASNKINLSRLELKYNTAYPGSMTIAQIIGTDIAVISMYGKNTYDYDNITGYSYLANLHRCLSDAAPLLDRFFSVQRFVIAGDWNAGPQWDKGVSRKNFNFFERLTTFDLKDCLGHFPDGGYETTFKHNGNRQIDWMFASQSLLVQKSYVDYAAEIEELSDHYPIITEFEI